MNETPGMFTEIERTRACWIRIRQYVLRELSDQTKVALSLKTQMAKVEPIEALLYG